MNSSNIPGATVSLQQNAIGVQLIVQFMEPPSQPGQPSPGPMDLVSASNLQIVIGYPDGTTATFNAQFVTDGSDGQIYYTTQNASDLPEVGLCSIQGMCDLYSIAVPPTGLGYFWVFANINGNTYTPPPPNVTALVFFDTNSARWIMYPGTSGGAPLIQAAATGPTNALDLTSIVFQDSNGIYWTITMSISGTYVATPGGTFAHALQSLIMLDSTGHGWVLTINTLGVLLYS